MKPKIQNPISLMNSCNALFDSEALIRAIYWYSKYPVCRNKSIFMYGKYAAVSIYNEKIHVHRLIMMWNIGRKLKTTEYVHHINGDRLNNLLSNLTIMSPSKHQSMSNKGRKFTIQHRARIGEGNRRRAKKHENPELLNPPSK